jgi:hypothetical protein
MSKLIVLASSIGLASAGCSEPDVAARGHVAASATPVIKPAAPIRGKTIAMSASKPCGNSNLERSLCMVELMIDDIRKTYDWPSGGGIGEIKQESSTSYTVSLPQEERADLFTYEFAVSDKAVSITSKTPGTQSY